LIYEGTKVAQLAARLRVAQQLSFLFEPTSDPTDVPIPREAFSVFKVKVSIAKSPVSIFANRVNRCSFAKSTTNHFGDFSGVLVWNAKRMQGQVLLIRR